MEARAETAKQLKRKREQADEQVQKRRRRRSAEEDELKTKKRMRRIDIRARLFGGPRSWYLDR